jgi:hypothetical protein
LCSARTDEAGLPGFAYCLALGAGGGVNSQYCGRPDRDSFLHRRSGNILLLHYQLYRTSPKKYFRDITSAGHGSANTGLFPTVPGYDLATGIGTPIMAALITATR